MLARIAPDREGRHTQPPSRRYPLSSFNHGRNSTLFQLMVIRGIPVALSFSYLFPVVLYGLETIQISVMLPVVYFIVLTASLLVHEFGHALVAAKYRLEPRVVLWALGGLTFHQPAPDTRAEAQVIVAGPAAGLAFGAVIWGIGQSLQSADPLFFRKNPLLGEGYTLAIYINIWWSLINLLPIFPLDGGHLLRVGLMRYKRDRKRNTQIVHGVGAALGLGAVLLAWNAGMRFGAFLGVLLIWENVKILWGDAAPGPAPTHNHHGDDLLADGEAALGRGDAREAVRLAYQVKAVSRLSREQTDRMWTLLGLATTELGDYDDALAYLQRAPNTEAVEAARARCVTALRR